MKKKYKTIKISADIMKDIEGREDFYYTNRIDNMDGTSMLAWDFQYYINECIYFNYTQYWTGKTVNDEEWDWHNGSWNYSVKEGMIINTEKDNECY